MPPSTPRRVIAPFHFELPQAVAQGALPATQTAFQALLGTLSTQVETYVADTIRALYEELREQIRLDRQRLFGARSEAHPLQGSLFNEAEWAADEAAVADDGAADTQAASEPGTPAPTSGPRRTHGGRQPLPPELPRVEVKLDLGEAERPCGTCGQDRVQIGETVSEQLNIVPMRIEVIRTIRSRYACPAGHVAPVVAPLPPTALPRTNFAPGFLATLLTTKYVDGLPLNRFAKVLQRHGVTVSRQTLARTVIATAKVLQPLANLAWDTVLEAPVIHMDETPVQVLKEPGKAPQSKSYMWVAKGGPPARPVVLYTYDPGRSGQVPLTLLEGWRGYLMTDGYEGYSAIAKRDRVEHLVCLVHARRKFVEAKRASPKGKATRADQALAFFARLYRIEAGVKEQDAATRWQARLHQSRPVLEQLRAWLTATRPVVTPKSKLGEALAYLDKYWPKLTRYTERGDLPIDNNPCENAIRPFVLGRKAWLFADTQAGAKASALLYSLVETAKANGLEPYTWLHHVLARLPAVTTVAGYEALMPWNVHPENLVEMSATA